MPTYAYVCCDCDEKYSDLQSINDTSLTPCTKCGSKKVKRLIGAGSGTIFKGTGFYTTDYNKKPGPTES